MGHLSRTIVIFLIAATCMLLGWIYWASNSPIITEWWLGNANVQSAGSWGDSFGAFNALVSSLGFAAIIATLLVQASALRGQQNDQHLQRFDSTFFELMKLMRELRDGVRFQHSQEYRAALPISKRPAINRIHQGNGAIIAAVKEFRFWVNIRKKNAGAIDASTLSEIYTIHVHRRYESSLSPYFRLIYTILSRIKTDSKLTDPERFFYAKILRSQLSSYDISLIAANALSPVAKDLFDLITEFRLLKYLPEGSMRKLLIDNIYKPEAFLARD